MVYKHSSSLIHEAGNDSVPTFCKPGLLFLPELRRQSHSIEHLFFQVCSNQFLDDMGWHLEEKLSAERRCGAYLTGVAVCQQSGSSSRACCPLQGCAIGGVCPRDRIYIGQIQQRLLELTSALRFPA